MAKNEEKKKGSKAVPAACGLAVLIAALFGGKQMGLIPFGDDGKGNGDVSSSSSVVEEVKETPETTEEVTAEPATDEVQYIEVTVSDGSYIYQNSTLTLDELMEQIQGTDLTVKLTYDKASKKAYDDILQALDEKNIPHIE
ncbi:MAG: hypothetical protein BWZ04_02784 [Firmicutes bacterium ADurb.BinA205]|nr:MAG: hypothetical protein BWZ04_02784 [Firmicutes bacterium ADurb.BinA205]